MSRIHPGDIAINERAGRMSATARAAADQAGERIAEARAPRHLLHAPRPSLRARVWASLTATSPEPTRDEHLAGLVWQADHPHADPGHFHGLPAWFRHDPAVRAARLAAVLTEDGWTRPDNAREANQ